MRKPLLLWRRKAVRFAILSVFTAGAIVAGITTAVATSNAAPNPVTFCPGCTPETDPQRIAEYNRIMDDFQQKISETTNDEEICAIRDEMIRTLVEEGFLQPVTGPETKGSEITIAGKTIQLPADAYVAGFSIIDVYAIPGMSEQEARRLYDNQNALEIRRGNSFVMIGTVTGDILWGGISTKEEQAFDFLKEAFPEQSEYIDTLPILSPR